jgi:hypothetical protein
MEYYLVIQQRNFFLLVSTEGITIRNQGMKRKRKRKMKFHFIYIYIYIYIYKKKRIINEIN